MRIDPCPFCGDSRAPYVQRSLGDRWHNFVRCNRCGAQGPTANEETDLKAARMAIIETSEREAIELWNNR